MKRSFTLLELLLSITIFSLITLALYHSSNTLKKSNKFYIGVEKKLATYNFINKTIFMDIYHANGKIDIHNEEKNIDTIIFQSRHSLYKNYLPYILYIVKDKYLFRVESYQKITYPVETLKENSIVDNLGVVENFRLYKKKDKDQYILDYRTKEDSIQPIRINLQ